MRTPVVALLALATLARSALAACPANPASTAAQICPGDGMCVVTQSFCIAANSTLDFGARDLVFEHHGQFEADGFVAIKAAKVNLMAVGGECAIVGSGTNVFIDASGDVTVGRDGNTTACIDVEGSDAGSIDITAQGAILVQGLLDAHASDDNAFGGSVSLAGLQVTVDSKAQIDVRGGQFLDAGTVDVDGTAHVTFRGAIQGKGNSGSDVTLTSEGDVDTTGSTLDLQGLNGGASGGLTIDSLGSVIVGGQLMMQGSSDGDGASDSGVIEVNADLDITIPATASIDLTGVPPDGAAGEATFDAGRNIVQAAKINAKANGNLGVGGVVELDAQGNSTLGDIDVSGPGPDGSGGSVTAQAWCSLTLPAGRAITANGPLGITLLSSGGALAIAGTVQAGASNTLEYRSPASLSLTGSVTPRTDHVDPSLTPCGGNVCGDGLVTGAEQCEGTGACAAAGTTCTSCQCRVVCGDGLVGAGEMCDPPATGTCPDGESCTSACQCNVQCGDGIIGAGETCDVGHDTCVGNEACSATCQCSTCGNGTIDGTEVCDPALPTSCPAGESCAGDCSGCVVRCGDGVIGAGEGCEPRVGGCGANDVCNAVTCQCAAVCGDGKIGTGEACDDGNTDACDGDCSANCSRPAKVCGDRIIECGEVCDGGAGDPCVTHCASDCSRFVPVCGDGVTECGEAGDDGNDVSCDGISATCQIEACGNGEPECAEECDDGAAGSSTCSPQCKSTAPPGCGDGILQADEGEICDDGNRADCDGCQGDCLRRDDVCGDRVVECGEQCDDGGQGGGDGCSPTCMREECGNGILDPGELCDQGARNGQPGAMCSTSCRRLDICSSESPGPCIPCADYLDCSPQGACGGAVCNAGICTPVPQPDCDDGNPCTADTCDPASGCVRTPLSGAVSGCDDGDGCTDDACSASTCVSTLQPGLGGATCRLGGLQALIDSGDIPKPTRRKLTKQAKIIAKRLPVASGTSRKAQKARKQIANGLKALSRTVAKAQQKLGPEMVSKLDAAINDTTVAVGNL